MAKSNGAKWRKLERSRARFWKPTDDTGALTVRLLERSLPKEGAKVQRARWLGEAIELAEDLRGPIKIGERIAIGETVVLADMLDEELLGQIVRITPAGLDGRVRLFEVEVAE
jgi:hypothetical protein